jgi:hypothetical protein
MVTEKVTVLPAAGLPGDQVTAEATRSELATGVTTRFCGWVYSLLASFCSTTVRASSTTARSTYEPAVRAPTFAVTVADAPAASAPTFAVPALVAPR